MRTWLSMGIVIVANFVNSVTGNTPHNPSLARPNHRAREVVMIAKLFSKASVMQRLRSGSTGPYVDGYAGWLIEQGYGRVASRMHCGYACHLGIWLDSQGVVLADVDETTLLRFCRHLSDCRCIRRNWAKFTPAEGSIRLFLSWLRTGQIFRRERPAAPAKSALLYSFHKWLREHRGLLPSTIRTHYGKRLNDFILALGDEPSAYTPLLVRKCLIDLTANYKAATVQGATSVMRTWLQYLVVRGLISPSLLFSVPTIPYWKHARFPSSISKDTVDQLISACDPSTTRGGRVRAALLLVARLGLRSGDVASLTLDDIDWENSTVRVMGKSRREVHLPLPQEVGDALLHYITTQRPKTSEHKVFLRVYPPFQPLCSSAVSQMVDSAINWAGLTLSRRGTNILRHSLASTLLNDEEMSLESIGSVLRHSSIETTLIYAKVDRNLLASVLQPWPEEVSP